MLNRISSALRRYALFIILDALLVAFSFYLALPMRFAGTPPAPYLDALQSLVSFIVLTYVITNYLFGLYHRIWRYASAQELVSIAGSVTTATLVVFVFNVFWLHQRRLPISTVLLGGFFSLAGFTTVRYRQRLITGFLHRWRRLRRREPWASRGYQRVLIVGAGEAGQLLAWRFLNQKEGQGYKLVGFVDDDPAKLGFRLHGIQVLGDRHAIPDLVARYGVDLIILAMYNISGEDFRAILDICEQTGAIIKVLPNVFDFLKKRQKLASLRDVTAEDLLGRKPVEIDRDACRNLLEGKTVLVTGAAGSIGSELCRQIITFSPRQLLMLDNNESGLYDLRFAILRLGSVQVSDLTIRNSQFTIHNSQLVPIIADITNQAKMRAVLETHHPQIVFHAAAYKHVPLMEAHPDEAVRVNVAGTLIAIELARQSGVERFVLVSTDKAVNPCNVMGATKRLCEMLIADSRLQIADGELSAIGHQPSAIGHRPSATLFTAVRFGNVLGSRGSVVPTFERQIEQGGPVTVTDSDMTRYFMSLSEAVSLVIQAATLTEGGDIFLLDMGQQIRIDDLARQLIRLRGLRPEVDIPIVYTGPRQGEKMHEELLGDGEERCPTSHPHIFRVQCKTEDGRRKMENGALDELIALAEAQRNGELVHRLRELVLTGSGPSATRTAGSTSCARAWLPRGGWRIADS